MDRFFFHPRYGLALVSVSQLFLSPVIKYSLTRFILRFLSQIYIISLGFQNKIWSLASVSRSILTPSKFSCSRHYHHLVECAITKISSS